MRKNTLKIMLAGATLAVCCGGAAYFTATAEDSANSAQTFSMRTGASIRLDNENSGIRFEASFGATLPEDAAKYYMMIIPESYVEKYSLSDDYYGELYAALKAEQAENSEENADTEPSEPYIAVMECDPVEIEGEMRIRGSLTAIKYENINRSWFGVAFYTDGAGEKHYASFNAGENVRDVVYVASKAIASGDYADDTEKSAILNTFVTQGYNAANGVSEENKNNDAHISPVVPENVSVDFQNGAAISYGVGGIPENVNLYYEIANNNENIVRYGNGTLTAVGSGNAEISVKILGKTLVSNVTVENSGEAAAAAQGNLFDCTANDRTHFKGANSSGSSLMQTGTATSVAGKEGNYLYFRSKGENDSSAQTYFGIFVNPIVTKEALAERLANGAQEIALRIYLEGGAGNKYNVLSRLNNLADESNADPSAVTITDNDYEKLQANTWTTIYFSLEKIVAAYDRLKNYTLFTIENKNLEDCKVYVESMKVVERAENDFGIDYFSCSAANANGLILADQNGKQVRWRTHFNGSGNNNVNRKRYGV